MRKILLASAAIAALAIPASAMAAERMDGTNCSYASDQDVSENVTPSIVVYADATGGDGGTTGEAEVVAGVCADNLNIVYPAGQGELDGGTVEAGAGEDSATGADDPPLDAAPDAYAVVDGDDDNDDPTAADESGGYAGLSNWESGTQEGCDAAENGTGSNSGDCLSIRTDDAHPPIISLPVPLLICGNTTGKMWNDSSRDGCTAVSTSSWPW